MLRQVSRNCVPQDRGAIRLHKMPGGFTLSVKESGKNFEDNETDAEPEKVNREVGETDAEPEKVSGEVDIEKPLKITESLEDELAKEHDLRLRAMADLENYRKRVERDRERDIMEGKKGILMKLIEVLDNFDFALSSIPEDMHDDGFVAGVRSIYNQLNRLLESQGVTSYECLGENFNPEIHEVVSCVDSNEHFPGTIISEVRRGYRTKDYVLRPSRVQVCKEMDDE